MIRTITLYCGIAMAAVLNAQNQRIDSLWNEYHKFENDSLKLEFLVENIAYELENIDIDSALSIYYKGLREATERKFVSLEARTTMYVAIMYSYTGKGAQAIEYYKLSMEKFTEMSQSEDPSIARMGKNGIASVSNNLSNIYNKMSDFPKALECLQKSSNIFEDLHNSRVDKEDYQYEIRKYTTDCNIGSIYLRLDDLVRAEEYLMSAYENLKRIADLKPDEITAQIGVLDATVNKGILFMNGKDFSKAKAIFLEGLDLATKLNIKPKAASVLNNLGNIAKTEDDIGAALRYFKQVLEIRKEYNDSYGLGIVYCNLSSIYVTLAKKSSISQELQQEYIRLALESANNAMKYGSEAQSYVIKTEAFVLLMEIYELMGEYKKALELFPSYVATKDSVYGEEKTKALTEMETRYQTEKKQQEIEKQKLVIEKQESEVRRQRLLRNFFIGGLLLFAFLALAIYRNYRLKKESNRIISEKNGLLEQANEEISAQRDMVIEQKNHIEEIHGELTSSIRYAKRIQGAVLPSQQQMSELLGNHFLLFKPKDIVSGDFYWATRVDNLTIFCVADCTGHGVPGAFMSMVGVSFLNDIVHKERITQASEILNYLRQSIITALKQKGEDREQKDGMDMGLCVLDKTTNRLQFAGGYNPCWIIPNCDSLPERHVEPAPDDMIDANGVIQLKANKMPIAIHKQMEPFTNYVVQLQPGDQVYLMSDGFQDQFGGPDGRKFMTKMLRNLIFANSKEQPDKQLQLLEKALEDWKNGLEQVDDVTILGVAV